MGVLTGNPLLREVVSDYAPPRERTKITIETGLTHTGVDSDSSTVQPFAGGKAYAPGRFVTW